jgi:hypothetical protein
MSGINPDDLELDPDDDSTFHDWEEETDDSDDVDAYADELKAAVEAFGVEVLEPGETRD